MDSTRPDGGSAKTGRNAARGHRLSRAIVGVPLLAAAGWLGLRVTRPADDLSLPQPVEGTRLDLGTPTGRLAVYVSDAAGAPRDPVPLLLVHSINAAGSAYEIGPIFERAKATRAVYAFDLPGFGLSDRIARLYTPRVMTDAVLAVVALIEDRHGAGPIDAMALSLSSEFLARAAAERPGAFRSVAFISPTGFDRRGPRNGPPNTNRGMPALYKTLTAGLWSRRLFGLLTSRVSIRYFLEKTFGSKRIDEGLADYDYRTTHQPGAEHAPYSFVSGYLFSADISRVYEQLQLPVWMLHGTKGDFQDYSGVGRVTSRPNWTIEVLETGALPHFELPDVVQARYDAFVSRLPSSPRP